MDVYFSKKKDISKLICIAIFLCFFDAILRIEQKNGLTFDRLFFVVPVMGMVFYESKVYCRFLLLYLIFSAYNAILSFKFGGFEYYLEMTLHYFIISNLLLFVSYLMSSDEGRDKLLKTLLFGFFVFIATTFSQIALDYHLPNVDVYENGEYSGFFRIANDQSLALAAFVPILILMLNEKKIPLIAAGLGVMGVIFICINNHTKTALGAVILFIIIYNMLKWRIKVSVTLFFISLLVLLVRDQTVQISYQTYTINELIIEPISYIFSFQTYETLGSIETRVNASIIGLRELFATYATGIGYGNSVSLLDKPENQLDFARSLHNDTLAFLLEQGLLAVVIYAYGVFRVFVMSKKGDYLSNIKHSSFYMFPVAILSSSGVTSNYYFLTCLFFLINAKNIHCRPVDSKKTKCHSRDNFCSRTIKP